MHVHVVVVGRLDVHVEVKLKYQALISTLFETMTLAAHCHCMRQASCPLNFWGFFCLCCLLYRRHTGVTAMYHHICLHMASGDLNSGPHVWKRSTLATELSA